MRFYITGEIESEPLAKALFNFFEGFQGFPKSRWWKENTIGSRLKSFQAVLPDFATARLEVAAAKERAHEERLTHLETTQAEVLKRLDDLEKRFPSQKTGLEEVQQALEQLDMLEQVWKDPPAGEAPARPILLDATDEEAVRHLGQALALFLGRDNRADPILDFRLVVPAALRQQTMDELSRVNLWTAQNVLEGRLLSYDGLEKNHDQARQEALEALMSGLLPGQTPEELAERGELLLVTSIRERWVLELGRYLEPAGLWMLDEAARRLEILQEAA